jgi:hypothetical protein
LIYSAEEVAAQTDAIFISHVHPDHMDPRTLNYFNRNTPIYIGEYKHKAFRDELIALGFKNVVECPFQTIVPVKETDFQVCIFESDYGESAAYDSSVIIQTSTYSIFNNNDCLLNNEKYHWAKERFEITYGFFGYSHASYFPICFEFDEQEKKELLDYWGEKHYQMFLDAASILRPKYSIPFAMGIRFLHESMLWQNISFNSVHTAMRRLKDLDLKGEVLNPGDTITTEGVKRRSPLLSDEDNDRAIREYAKSKQAWIESIWNSEASATPKLVSTFQMQITDHWIANKDKFPDVKKTVIAYKITGPNGGEFYADFSRDPKDIFVIGVPERFDMRYTYEDKLLQLRVDKIIDWDELHFSNRVSVKQNVYAASFYSFLRSQDTLLSRE